MINKVGNQKYYEYSKINQQKRETTESSEFNLDLGNQGVVYEKGGQKKSEKAKGAAEKDAQRAGAQPNPGVKVEISRQAYKRIKAKKQGASLSEEVRKYAAIAIDFLKSLWDKIWNDNTASPKEGFPEVLEGKLAESKQAEDAGAKDATAFFGGIQPPEASEGAAQAVSGQPDGEDRAERFWDWISKTEKPGAAEEPAYTQEEIRRIFRRGNRKEIEDFLSNHGERHLAKNTELLTKYDKKGTIVGIDHAQKELILFGNKNEIRL